jgi:small ligand-binding sensory domain FIST
MSRFGDGLAADSDVVHAAELAAGQALEPLSSRTPDLACVFVSGPDPDDCAAAAVRAAEITGAPAVIGCTAGGVIGAGAAVEAMSAVSVWVGVLPDVQVRSFHLEVMRADAGLAVVGLPERADDDAVVVLLADPWSFPADGFVERSNEALVGLPIVGGLASGPRGAGSTRLLIDGRIVERGAVGVLLGGPVAARTLVSQGCRPIGPPMTVTAAEGNVLLGLAGERAIDKLEHILGMLDPRDQALATQGLHIGIAVDEYAEEHDRGDFLIRGVLGADKATGGIVVGDVVETGRTVSFQVRDADSADEDLRLLLGQFHKRSGFDNVEGALLFSCNGRGAGLFGSADHDVRAVRDGLATTGVGGFFAAGEIGPVGGRNHVHGFTASVLAFGSGSHAARGTAAGIDEPTAEPMRSPKA